MLLLVGLALTLNAAAFLFFFLLQSRPFLLSGKLPVKFSWVFDCEELRQKLFYSWVVFRPRSTDDAWSVFLKRDINPTLMRWFSACLEVL